MFNWEKIYFDLDNTLFSYEYAFEKAVQDCYQDVVEGLLEKENLQVTLPVGADWFDVFKFYSDYYWENYENKKYTQPEYRRIRYVKTMQHFQLPCSHEDADIFHEKYYAKAVEYVRPFKGLHELLSYLSEQQVELGILTNGNSNVQSEKIKKLRISSYIPMENIYISESVGLEKPDRAIFDCVSGQAKADKCLFIGDSWEHDVVGALEAGWQAIYLNTLNVPRATSHQPLAEFVQLSHLISYFKESRNTACFHN